MPSGAKKRKAAKKKQEEQASSTQINLKSNNHESRSQEERESSDDGVSKKAGFTDERVVITDSSHDHDKSSSSSSRSSSSSNSTSSSDDESREVQKKDDIKETVSEVTTVSYVPDQPVPIAGDAPFLGSTANVIVENTGLMDSVTSSDPNSEKTIEILPVETMIANEAEEISLPKSNEITAEASLKTVSDVKENEGKTSPLPESNVVPPEDSRESVISHEEEAPVRSTHGVVQRTSWLSCCGLFDVVTGSSR